MTDQKDQKENERTNDTGQEQDGGVENTGRRDVLKTVAGATAISALGGLGAGTAKAQQKGGLTDAVVSPLQRDRFPPTQGARNWTTNAAYWYEFPSNDPNDLEVWGYTDKMSYAPGDEVALHVNTTADTFEIEIQRDGGTLETVMTKSGIKGGYHETPIECYEKGCGWPVSHRFTIPADWKSGGYIIVLRVERDGQVIEQDAWFTLRAKNPGANADILFVLSTGTWLAYTDFGGGSSYRIPPEKGGGGMESRQDGREVRGRIRQRNVAHRQGNRSFR